MLTKSVEAGLNEQMAMEFHAAHVYLSMAAYFEGESLNGFSKWMRMQHEEELMHAKRLFDFILNNGGRVKLQAIAEPPTEFSGPLQIMEQSLAHERKVTASINKLYALAVKEDDYPTQVEMQWFINEQSEEERTLGDNVARLKLAGDNGAALLMLDAELGGRRSGEGE